MKKNFKKFASLMLALVMAIGLAAPAFAADATATYTRLTNPAGYDYTYFRNAGGSVNLAVCGADDTWQARALTETQAKAITWTLPYGGEGVLTLNSTASGGHDVTYKTGEGDNTATETGWYAETTVTIAENAAPGVYSVQANDGDASFNYTIVVESQNAASELKNVSVKVVVNGQRVVNNVAVNVSSAASMPNSPMHGSSAAIQNDPCAMGTLDGLISRSQISSYTQSGGYVNAITIGNTKYEGTYTAGWSYGVYNSQGTLVSISSVVSPSAFPLESGQKVLWVYGAYGSVVIPGTWNLA